VRCPLQCTQQLPRGGGPAFGLWGGRGRSCGVHISRCAPSAHLARCCAALRCAAQVMVAQSYSKNLGLYGERVGALNVVTSDAEVRRPPLQRLPAAASPCAVAALPGPSACVRQAPGLARASAAAHHCWAPLVVRCRRLSACCRSSSALRVPCGPTRPPMAPASPQRWEPPPAGACAAVATTVACSRRPSTTAVHPGRSSAASSPPLSHDPRPAALPAALPYPALLPCPAARGAGGGRRRHV